MTQNPTPLKQEFQKIIYKYLGDHYLTNKIIVLQIIFTNTPLPFTRVARTKLDPKSNIECHNLFPTLRLDPTLGIQESFFNSIYIWMKLIQLSKPVHVHLAPHISPNGQLH